MKKLFTTYYEQKRFAEPSPDYFPALTGRGERGILWHTMLGPWRKHFLNLIYPLFCLLCKVKLHPLSDKPLCDICWSKIEFNLPPYCRICGRHLPAPSQNQVLLCQDCHKRRYFFSAAHSVCVYDGIIKECIHLLKYNRKLALVGPLSELLFDFSRRYLDLSACDLIIPVPLHRAKLRQRQFNQAALLAAALGRAYSKESAEKILIKIIPSPAQVKLSQKQRLRNVRGAFKVRSGRLLKEKNVLLVDDVLTTGATVNECAKTLLEAGCARVNVLTLACSR